MPLEIGGWDLCLSLERKKRSEMWGVQRKGNLPQARLTQVLTAAKILPYGSGRPNFKSSIKVNEAGQMELRLSGGAENVIANTLRADMSQSNGTYRVRA